jgi:hypothetical protein
MQDLHHFSSYPPALADLRSAVMDSNYISSEYAIFLRIIAKYGKKSQSDVTVQQTGAVVRSCVIRRETARWTALPIHG